MTATQTTSSILQRLHDIAQSSNVAHQQLEINDLYEFPVEALEKVLFQAVHLCVTLGNENLQLLLRKFVVHLAAKSLYLGLRISWIVDAVLPSFQSCGLGAQVVDLKDAIETATINQHSTPPTRKHAAETNVREELMQKQERLNLFSRERSFVQQLTQISSALVKVSERAKRIGELHKLLTTLNTEISTSRIFVPLGDPTGHVKWIVNIVISECAVFSSRERAPYLLFCEVIADESTPLLHPSHSAEDVVEQILEKHRTPTQEVPLSLHGKTKSGDFGAEESFGLLSSVFGESTSEKRARIRKNSKFGAHRHWSTEAIIVKAGDDLRQEELALQLIAMFNMVWQDAGVTLCVKPYSALSTTPDGGLLQCVADACSIDGIKKKAGVQSLHQFFIEAYGGEDTFAYSVAQKNFVESIAGYSIISYLLQIKDRHNGNLMLTRAGHLVHIDFGFMLATSPGGIRFESAPFKLSQELMDVMGGINSAPFNYFKILVLQGMIAARERADELIGVIELVTPYNTLPCFGPDAAAVLSQVRNRFRLDLESPCEFALYIRELIAVSVDNWRTRKYDQFQTLQNGII